MSDMATSLLLATQALVSGQDGIELHPDLFLWQKQLCARKRHWFSCADRTPCEWYAVLQGQNATAMLASKVHSFVGTVSQCWMVTPYHAQPERDSVRIYSEGLSTWHESDAVWLCDTLNPLLSEEHMHLHHVDAALLLACRDPLDARPLSFSAVSGKQMPARHHAGSDGGKLNRLLAEIQMVLHMHQSEQHTSGRGVNGVWISDPVTWPQRCHEKELAVATRNPSLAAIVSGRDAAVVISEVERLSELLPSSGKLPKRVLLTGEGHAVLLERGWLPKLGKGIWSSPESAAPEFEMISVLQGAF